MITKMTEKQKERAREAMREVHKNDTPDYAAPGTHVWMIKDRPAYAEAKLETFLQNMSKNYPTFNVTGQSQSSIPTGVCIYITYTI